MSPITPSALETNQTKIVVRFILAGIFIPSRTHGNGAFWEGGKEERGYCSTMIGSMQLIRYPTAVFWTYFVFMSRHYSSIIR